ncbi:hypothetical protein N7537_003015 [Penicillium hordei]|uniref:Uncharacterized protein n=1 Tax=Penicillium hordei TaxID=40994 RepID=A0AAD6EJ25_9EURO|nr:uncharacterized protein N7537_003015 [Penicillium hordei]KAJ5617901.1 hypothetical protein N7537_003015 [Penicillium hordei]
MCGKKWWENHNLESEVGMIPVYAMPYWAKTHAKTAQVKPLHRPFDCRSLKPDVGGIENKICAR